MMENIPIEVILVAIGAGAAAILLLRFGRAIARFLLILAGVAVAGVVGFALLSQARATRETAEAVKVASVGQTVTATLNSFLAGVLFAVTLAAAVAVGYLWLKARLARQGPKVYRLPRRRPGRPLPPPWYAGWPDAPPVVYYVDDDGQESDLPVDPAEWGWYE